ncbi:MAG: ABC-2 family transporter protein [Myxococcota bacterium]
MRIYLALLGASVRAQLAYRGAVWLEALGRFWVTSLELVGVLVVFTITDGLGGFGRWEVVYLYGVATTALGVASVVTDGLKDMPHLVRTGQLDGMLVRPLSPLLQVLGRQCRLMQVGRPAQGALTLLWALWHVAPDGPLRYGMVGVNVAATTAVFSGLFVLEGASTVFTVQAAEAFSAFTYGGAQMTQYPVPIYPAWLQRVFLWVVPVGTACYLPALVVLGHPDPLGLPGWAPWVAPLGALAFFGACLLGWRAALDRYTGTGS